MNVGVMLCTRYLGVLQRLMVGHDAMVHAEAVHVTEHVFHAPGQQQRQRTPGLADHGIRHCNLAHSQTMTLYAVGSVAALLRS